MPETIIAPTDWQDHIGLGEDGDWDIVFVFEGYTVRVAQTGENPEQAIRYAEGRLPQAIFDEELLEVTAQLMGVFK